MKPRSPFSMDVEPSPQLLRGRHIAAGVLLIVALLCAFWWWKTFPFREHHQILHVSFDAFRHVSQELDPQFESQARDSTFEFLDIQTHHAGSIQQAKGVATGLIADVASFATPMEIVEIQRRGIAVPDDWEQRYPHHSSPCYSTVVWVVKPSAGTLAPAWSSLLGTSVRPCMPDPTASGAGRYAYLAVIIGSRTHPSPSSTAFASPQANRILEKIHITGDRASSAARQFLQSPHLNVLLTWESEALQLLRQHAHSGLTIVYPEHPILAEPVVVELVQHTAQRGTGPSVHAYLNYQFTEAAQSAFAKAGFRPRLKQVLHADTPEFPELDWVAIESALGPWPELLDSAFGPKGHYTHLQALRKARHGGSE
ncbi:MAG: sulfate ABC transporter substrate-binding protein [Puniceicoccaceae bacterium]